MKTIVDKCFDESIPQMDNIKLRLRGRGSGYKEGPDRKESHEDLHLCVSGKLYSKFKLACSLVEHHLKQIYSDYKELINLKYKEDNEEIKILKKEACSNKKK
jgi:hypothetical protein